MSMNTKLSPMCHDDDEANEAAMQHFDGEDAPAELPAMYPTDDAAYAAAEQYFD